MADGRTTLSSSHFARFGPAPFVGEVALVDVASV